MSLTVHPDPQEPAGGFAFLELPEGSLSDAQVTVAVFGVYGERWLAPSEGTGGQVEVGDGHWQSERHDFGPYAVHRHDGADWVRIGPEIVNKIDEYTPVRISVGAVTQDVSWPDDVPPRAGAAVLGGIQATGAKPDTGESSTLVGKPATPPEVEPVVDPVVVVDPPAPAPAQPVPRRTLLVLIFLALAVLLAVLLAYWLLPKDDPVDDPQTLPISTVQCTPAAINAVTGGFAATEKVIRACGDALSADTVLKLVEDASAAGDAEALLVFGTLYDGAQVDARIEQVIGLTFDHDAAKAAEYYARAVKAGSEIAQTRLTATCAQLAGSDMTLAKGAFDDFCQ
jgi:hypothetical protein